MYRLIYVVERLDGSEHRVQAVNPETKELVTVDDYTLARNMADVTFELSERVKTANVIRIDIEEV